MIRTRFSLSLLAGLFLAVTAQAVPTRYSADAGEIRDIRFASGTGATAVFYAASQGGGVFKSVNAGTTWTATGLNKGYAWKIAVSPLNTSRVYAATEAGLYRSIDAGVTWVQMTFDPVRTVAIDPGSVTNDTVLIGVKGHGVLKSIDSGATFTRHSNGLDSTDVINIVYQAASTAYVLLQCNVEDVVSPYTRGGWGGIFRATNANAASTIAWANYQAPGGGAALPTKCVTAVAANATTVFVGTQDPILLQGQIYRTTGAGWTTGPAAGGTGGNLVGVQSLMIDRNSTTVIHAGSRAVGVWGSTDSGVNWSQKVDPSPGESPDLWTNINAVESVPGLANTVLAAPRGLGLMRSTNYNNAPANAIDWNVGVGITADRVRGVANHAVAAPTTYWMALYGGGVMKAPNINAPAWTQFIAGMDLGAPLGSVDMLLSGEAIAADPNNASVVLVGTRGAGLLQLTGGTSWTRAGMPASMNNLGGPAIFQPQHLLMPTSSKIYYALFNAPGGGSAGGLVQSTTGVAGLTQTPYPEGIVGCTVPAPGAQPSAYRVTQTPSGIAYLMRYDGLPYRSTTEFTTNTSPCITATNVGFERLYFYDIAEQPNNSGIVVGATNKGIYRSTNGGVNWARLNITGLPVQVLSGIAYIGNGILYGISRAGGLYCSSNNGDNWSTVSLGGLPAASFREIKLINGAIHVLTDGAGFYTGFAATCP